MIKLFFVPFTNLLYARFSLNFWKQLGKLGFVYAYCFKQTKSERNLSNEFCDRQEVQVSFTV